MIRTQVICNLTDLVDGISGRGGDLVEVLACGLRVIVPARDTCRGGAILHDEQVLSEAVVQLGCDALPLRLLRGDQLLCEGLLRFAASRRMRVMLPPVGKC